MGVERHSHYEAKKKEEKFTGDKCDDNTTDKRNGVGYHDGGKATIAVGQPADEDSARQ